MTKFFAYNKDAFSLMKTFWKESYIFIIFWFINAFIPIAICMISAAIPNDGAYYVIVIGYVTAFQLAYVQIGWTVSIALTYTILQMKFTKNKVEGQAQGDLMYATVLITLFYGLLLVPFFIGPSYAYSRFANNHVNTVVSQQSAYNYIWTLSGYIFLSPFMSLMIIYIHSYKGQKRSIIAIVASNALIVGLSAILTLTPNASNTVKAIGTGLGMTIGAIVCSVVLGVYVYLTTELRYASFKFNWKEIKFISLKTIKQASSILSIQIFKAIALIALGLVISNVMDSVVPMGYQFSRVVWYNYLYLVPFFAYGVADSMMFFGLRQRIEIKYRQMFLAFISIIVTAFLVEIVIAIGAYWTIEPLCGFYTRNSQLDWSTVDLNRVNLPFMLSQMADKFGIDQSYVNAILNKIEADPQGTMQLQIFLKTTIVALLSNQGMNAKDLAAFMVYPQARAYIFIATYAVFYSTANVINNTSLVMKHRYQDLKETISLMVIQAAVISAVIAMGIELQSGTVLPYLDAWSLPLFIIGLLSVLYYALIFARTVTEIEKEFAGKTHTYVVLNENKAYKENEPNPVILELNNENELVNEQQSEMVLETAE